MADAKTAIESGRTSVGIEFGSTRIKAVLIDEAHTPIASGSFDWENRLENGIWTYSLELIHEGLRGCFADLAKNVQKTYGVPLIRTGAMGVSAMMHGYMAFDAAGNLLVPFRTWRNTITEQAARELTELFSFNIPQRWSIAHLEQAILNGEAHVKDIAFITTLAGYIHWKLTGKKVLGVGDASGMFPIDSSTGSYDERMLDAYDARNAARGLPWSIRGILPQVLTAGDDAGTLTEEGAALLAPDGSFGAGVRLCPPEGDAGTGMTATNAVAEKTGNVSAGTSVFAMIVLEKPLSAVYPEIDMVTTPDGKPVAMVHCNNCSSDIDAWIGLFREYSALTGLQLTKGQIYDLLYNQALAADADCSGIVSFNYFSGEPITGLDEGRPMFIRMPDSKFTLANFMRANLYSAIATLKIGMDILFNKEQVVLDRLVGHGGFFKTPVVGQRMMAAVGIPVSVMETAGEGGAWGIAVLAAYAAHKGSGETLGAYLNERVFAGLPVKTLEPDAADAAGFNAYIANYKNALPAEKAAVQNLNIQ